MKEAGFLLTEQDKENNEIIKNLVKKHFSLDYSSYSYFQQQIDNPLIDDVYFEAFNKFGSSKIELDIPLEIQENMDYGWQKVIKTNFSKFVDEVGVTYGNYKKNIIEIDKNFIKLKKAIQAFYSKSIIKEIYENLKEIQDNNFYVLTEKEQSSLIKNELNKIRNKEDYYTLFHSFDYSYKTMPLNDFIHNVLFEEDKKEIKNKEDILVSLIKKDIESIWQLASEEKITSDNIKIVITFSFADWFLCSTNESWGSCLSLNGNSANFWYGLPGLIGDKNRVMIYITRGDEKEYRGIKTHHYLYRTWALLDEKNKINIVRWFPNENLHDFNLYNFITEKTGLSFNKEPIRERSSFKSKHSVDLIWTDNNFSLFPYQDFTTFTEGEESYIERGQSGMFYKERSSLYVYENEIFSYDAFSSLGDLIYMNTSICEAEELSVCESCGVHLSEGNIYHSPNGDILCESCYQDQYFYCEGCDRTCLLEDSFETQDGLVCEDCYHNEYFTDELDDKIYRLSDSVTASENRDGSNQFLIYIDNASDYDFIYNENDGVYYKKEFMVKLKNGEFIHVNDYENQLELAI